MAKRFTERHNGITFDSHLMIRDENDDEKEIDITVEADYTPGSPGCWYRANGDPGDPPEPAECEITQIVGPNGLIEFDSLPKQDQDRLMEDAIAKGEEGPDEPEPEYDPTDDYEEKHDVKYRSNNDTDYFVQSGL